MPEIVGNSCFVAQLYVCKYIYSIKNIATLHKNVQICGNLETYLLRTSEVYYCPKFSLRTTDKKLREVSKANFRKSKLPVPVTQA